jgi:hypothetical protein
MRHRLYEYDNFSPYVAPPKTGARLLLNNYKIRFFYDISIYFIRIVSFYRDSPAQAGLKRRFSPLREVKHLFRVLRSE